MSEELNVVAGTEAAAAPAGLPMRWYVVHAYSGMEKAVERNIVERINRAGMQDKFGRILVPTEEVVEVKNGVKRTTERKFFPGYVLVEMVMDDETWHLVKHTNKVTGFVGGLHVHAAGMQHLEGVAGAVAQRDDHVRGGDLLAGFQRQAPNAAPIGAVLDVQVGHLLLEADLAAQALDLGAHLDDHADQPEGTDVRLADVEDLLRRAGLDELGQHLAGEEAGVGDLAVELAVREGAGAALAKLHIRFGM